MCVCVCVCLCVYVYFFIPMIRWATLGSYNQGFFIYLNLVTLISRLRYSDRGLKFLMLFKKVTQDPQLKIPLERLLCPKKIHRFQSDLNS